jgi:hypothetical protein
VFWQAVGKCQHAVLNCQQVVLNLKAVCIPTAKYGAMFVANSALFGVFGAVSGAVGWSVMNASGWKVADIDLSYFTLAMTAGSAGVSIPMSCFNLDFLTWPQRNYDLATILKKEARYIFWTGAISGLGGAALLNAPYKDEVISFSAAAGATGNAVLVMAASVLCVMTNRITGNKFLCFKNQDEVVKFFHLPEVVTTAIQMQPIVATTERPSDTAELTELEQDAAQRNVLAMV